jgi:hypothetical protein
MRCIGFSLLPMCLFTLSAHAQLVGGTTYPINGTENPPTSFSNISSAVAYLLANGVTGSGVVALELSSGYPGIEPEPVTIGPITGTDSSLGVVFRPAAGFAASTLVVGGGSPDQHAISLAGCSYITLDGRSGGTGSSRDWTVRVAGSGTTGNGQMAVRLNGAAGSMTGIVVRNLMLIGEAANTTGGVFQIIGNASNPVSNVVVEHNFVTSTAISPTTTRAYGISIESPLNNAANTGIIIRYNVITNTYGRGINITAACPGMQVYNNEIYHTTAITQPATIQFSGIYFSSTLTNANSNRIYNNRVHGIRLTNGATAVNGIYTIGSPSTGGRLAIFNNMISIGHDLTGTAAELPVYGIREQSLSTSLYDIWHNSVYVGGGLSSGSSVSSAFRKQTSNNISLRNNIFHNARTNSGGTGTHYAIMVNNTLATSRDNNDYSVSGTGGVLGTTTGTSAGNRLTLEEWQTAVGGDLGSISEHPRYLNPTATPADLRIDTAYATLLESGAFELPAVTTDVAGTPRYPHPGYPEHPLFPPTSPDIGAHEFAGRRTTSLPAQVILLSPAHGSMVEGDSALCIWASGTPEVTAYWFERATDSLFTISLIVDSTLTDTTTVTRQLVANTTYWWRVRAGNAAGWGEFSEARSFEVVTVGVAEEGELPELFSLLQNYPNPFNPSTTFTFYIQRFTFVIFSVYDLLGREVATLVNEAMQPGDHTVTWDASGMPSGVYFYRLTAGGFSQSRKLVLLR